MRVHAGPFGIAESSTANRLAAADVSGDIAGGVTVSALRWDDGSVQVLVPTVRVHAEVELLPLVVRVGELDVDEVNIASRSTSGVDSAPIAPGDVTASLPLPLTLEMHNVAIDRLTIDNGNGENLIIEEIALDAVWSDTLAIEALRARGHGVAVDLKGLVALSDSAPFDLQVALSTADVQVDATGSGDLEQFRLAASIAATVPDIGAVNAEVHGVGSLTGLVVESLLVDGPNLRLLGAGDVDWAQQLRARLDVDLERLAMTPFTAGWPAANPVFGVFEVELEPAAVRISDAVLGIAGTRASLMADGHWDPPSNTVGGTLSWSELQWPIGTVDPQFSSSVGDVEVGGSLDDWFVDGMMAVSAAEVPDGVFNLRGNGDRDRVTAEIVDSAVFGGAVSGTLDYEWRGAEPWSVALYLQDVETSQILPDWPGVIGGYIEAAGTRKPLQVSARLDNVSGTLRGEPVRANGKLVHDETTTRADNLALVHGNASATLNGAANTGDGLTFSLQLDAAERYLDGVAGALQAHGAVSLSAEAPHLSVNLDSPELTLGDVVLHDFEVRNRRSDDQIAAIEASAARLTLSGQRLDSVRTELLYAPNEQRIDVSFEHAATPVRVSMNGAFNDWRDPLRSTWRGFIDEFAFDFGPGRRFELQAPAALLLSPDHIALREMCLQEASDARICVNAERSPAHDIHLDAGITDLPLQMIARLAVPGLAFEQNASGTIDVRRTSGGVFSGNAVLATTPGRVTSVEDPALTLETDRGQVEFTIVDGKLLSGVVKVPMPGVGGIDATLSLADLTQPTSSDLAGRISVTMNDIAIAAPVIPAIDAIGGRLVGDVEFSGSVAAPAVNGRFDIDDGTLRYQPIGLQLDDIAVRGELSGFGTLLLDGQFTAGSGRGRIISSADYRDSDRPGLQFRISGEKLRLVDVPDVSAVVSPNIDVDLSGEHLDIDGTLNIDRARVTPAYLAENRVDESSDVVIVAGDAMTQGGNGEPNSRLRFGGKLDVVLGDDVRVDVDVARAFLGGAVTFSWDGEPMPMADGRIGVNGTIQAFGQVLNISQGAVRFPKVAASNPTIRLRAEREIYGNSQVKKAGVLVDGPAERPTIEPYTIPATTEERALTLLVTGSDFDYEQGVGAVDFGTYIAPKLFVSYGVGIFDRDNVISARYDLGRGFGVKASSGSQESGIDLSYSFDN